MVITPKDIHVDFTGFGDRSFFYFNESLNRLYFTEMEKRSIVWYYDYNNDASHKLKLDLRF
jgi:hypothetical protein